MNRTEKMKLAIRVSLNMAYYRWTCTVNKDKPTREDACKKVNDTLFSWLKAGQPYLYYINWGQWAMHYLLAPVRKLYLIR